MVNLRRRIFGYVAVTLKEECVESALNLLLKMNICATLEKNGAVYLSLSEYERFLEGGGADAVGRVSEARGLLPFLRCFKRRVGTSCALLLVFLILFLSERIVFDVRVTSDFEGLDADVEQLLSECGLYVGARWSEIDKNYVEAEFLSKCSEVGWISVNRRGSVAYVELLKREGTDGEGDAPLYSNIVADRDCVIVSVAVRRGVPTVKPGDVVRAGQLLVSGVYEADGRVVFTRAEGEIVAQSAEDVRVFVPRTEELIFTAEERTVSLAFNFFNFSINIFKKYGNCPSLYDIIEKTESFYAFADVRLPFGYTRVCGKEYEKRTVRRTDAEIVSLAGEKMRELINSRFADSDVVRIRTDADFQKDGYGMTSRVVYEARVGIEKAIEIADMEMKN